MDITFPFICECRYYSTMPLAIRQLFEHVDLDFQPPGKNLRPSAVASSSASALLCASSSLVSSSSPSANQVVEDANGMDGIVDAMPFVRHDFDSVDMAPAAQSLASSSASSSSAESAALLLSNSTNADPADAAANSNGSNSAAQVRYQTLNFNHRISNVMHCIDHSIFAHFPCENRFLSIHFTF